MKTDYQVGDKVVVIELPLSLRYSSGIFVGQILQIRQVNYPDPDRWDVYFEEDSGGLNFCYIRPATLLEKTLYEED